MATVEAGEGRPVAATYAGLGFYYALVPFAVGGIVVLRRRRIDQWFLLAPAAVVTVVSAVVIALVRYRAPFEVCLVVLAAAGIVVPRATAVRPGPGRRDGASGVGDELTVGVDLYRDRCQPAVAGVGSRRCRLRRRTPSRGRGRRELGSLDE